MEHLENEKKQYTERIASLEDSLKQVGEETRAQKIYYKNSIQGMKAGREELVANPAMEIGDLRKKVYILTNRIKILESAPMQTSAQNNTPFSTLYSDIEDVSIEAGHNRLLRMRASDSIPTTNDLPMTVAPPFTNILSGQGRAC